LSHTARSHVFSLFFTKAVTLILMRKVKEKKEKKEKEEKEEEEKEKPKRWQMAIKG
jgi:membrane protein insertase Oxa1/YidC/SpoIIIJ